MFGSVPWELVGVRGNRLVYSGEVLPVTLVRLWEVSTDRVPLFTDDGSPQSL